MLTTYGWFTFGKSGYASSGGAAELVLRELMQTKQIVLPELVRL